MHRLIGLALMGLISLAHGELTPEEAQDLEEGVFQVVRTRPTSRAQLDALHELFLKAEEHRLDFWLFPTGLNASVDVMAGPRELPGYLSLLSSLGMEHTVTIGDVQKLTEQRNTKSAQRKLLNRRKRQNAPFYDFQRYQELDEMQEYMEGLARDFPQIVELETIGESHEERPIQVLKIGNKDRSWGKKSIWVDGGMHAREWAAPHTAMYFANQLVTEYGRDDEIRWMVDNLNWYVAPMVNPDGYVHSRSGSHPNVRLWRKNRAPNRCGRRKCCKGVDLNRNFDFHWLESGSSSNPCSEVYAGATSFSEPEAKAIRDFVLRRGSELEGFITLHTYSQLWVHAFGHQKGEYPSDWRDLARTGKRAARALYKLYQTKYKIGSGADALYPASGGSDDWAKDRARVKFVYLLELRPSEEEWDGFILDENQLVPTAQETWAGLKVVAREILRRSSRTYVGMASDEDEMEDADVPAATPAPACQDKRYSCSRWAKRSRSGVENCLTVRQFMLEQCRLSCSQRFQGFC